MQRLHVSTVRRDLWKHLETVGTGGDKINLPGQFFNTRPRKREELTEGEQSPHTLKSLFWYGLLREQILSISNDQ
jgi:hypothetical protein